MKLLSLLILLLSVSSCFVSKKKYISLEQEIIQLKSGLKDDDKDGVPNYVDLEPKTDSLANVDSKGRTLIVEKIVDIDQDGILDTEDFCPTIKGIAAANGCPDKDGDCLYDFMDKCPSAAGDKEDNGCPVVSKRNSTCEGFGEGRVFIFKKGKAIVTEETKKNMESYVSIIAKTMLENPTYLLTITGKSDYDSKDIVKLKEISLKRALMVKDLLISKGIEASRIETIGDGTSNLPFKKEDKNHARNNRVDFAINIKEE